MHLESEGVEKKGLLDPLVAPACSTSVVASSPKVIQSPLEIGYTVSFLKQLTVLSQQKHPMTSNI